MRIRLAVIILSISGFDAALAQQPPASQLSPNLRDIQISAPPPERVQNRDTQIFRYRVHGTFIVENKSGFDVKDLGIRCQLKGSSGTDLPGGPYEVIIRENIQSWRRHTSREITLTDAGDQQTVGIACEAINAVPLGRREQPQPPPPPEKWVYRPVGIQPGECADCPDYAERFNTSNVDLATQLINDPRNPRYLIAKRPDPVPRPLTASDRVRRR
jgi:hypothetical protein